MGLKAQDTCGLGNRYSRIFLQDNKIRYRNVAQKITAILTLYCKHADTLTKQIANNLLCVLPTLFQHAFNYSCMLVTYVNFDVEEKRSTTDLYMYRLVHCTTVFSHSLS